MYLNALQRTNKNQQQEKIMEEQSSGNLIDLHRNKDALERVMDAMTYASEEVYGSLWEICKQIVKEMYESLYD